MARDYGDDPTVGSQYSGTARRVVVGGGNFSVLRCSRSNQAPGMAQIHVAVSDELVDESTNHTEQRTILTVKWQTKIGGGEAEVDATQGSFFTVGGADSIQLDARTEFTLPLAAPYGLRNKRVEAVVHWVGSMAARAAYMTSPRVVVPGNTVSTAKMRIPAQASAVMLLVDDPAALKDMQLRFFAGSRVDNQIVYATQLPDEAEKTPIVSGVEYFEIVKLTAGAVNAIASFELWL